MNNFILILLIILIVVISLIGEYENRQLRKDITENKNLISRLKKEVGNNYYYRYDLEEKYKLICNQCDKTIKEFNEIMFGSPPLKNKVIIVRSIKDYDYSAYRKDIEALNEYLDKGWTIVNHESNEFVHTYILGMPLKWLKEKEGDMNDERES
jgi:hypothetical protein